MIPLRIPAALSLMFAGAAPCAAQYVLAEHSGWPDLIGVDDAEFTPDGRLLVARDNTIDTTTLVYDARTGAEVYRYTPTNTGHFGGTCEDAVAVTNDRAVVIGTRVLFLDLNNLAGGPLAERDAGSRPRDLALTPDGTLVAVRGDDAQYIYDVTTGAQLASAPGVPLMWSPSTYSVDSVVADDEHAVVLSWVAPSSTRVTIWDLHPAGGGPPAVVFETTAANDQAGTPHDLALTPSGRHVAVRSESQVGLYRLSGSASHQVWSKDLKFQLADPFDGSAMDSIEATDRRVVTISRRSTSSPGAQLDLYTVPGGDRKYQLLKGVPHDLALTPNGERLVVRTHKRVYLFDVAILPTLEFLLPLDDVYQEATHQGWAAGMDSLAVTADRALVVVRQDWDTKILTYDLSADRLDQVFVTFLGEPVCDLAITPDRSRATVAGVTRMMVLDMRLNEVVLDHDVGVGGTYPWCDGVAVTDEQAACFGYIQDNLDGWLGVVDLFSRAGNYCTSTPNSTGQAATIVVSGSSRESVNDLRLSALGMPGGEFGQFVYGDVRQQVPFGSGFLCVTGQLARFPVQVVDTGGRAILDVDNTNLPVGGGDLTMGTSWHFQFVYRDSLAGGGYNTTDGVSVLFE